MLFRPRVVRQCSFLHLPWNLSGKPKRFKKEPVCSVSQHWLDDYTDGFKYAYQQLLTAIAKQEFDYVESMCEPRLYNAFRAGMLKSSNEHLVLKLQNPESEVDCTFYNDRIITGLDVVRENNSPEFRKILFA
jgi:hypothetical protein